MAKKTTNIGYTHQERILMLHGYVVKQDHPVLYSIVERYGMIDEQIYASLGPIDDYTDMLLHRKNGILNDIIDILQNEWETISEDGSNCKEDPLKKHVCQLCGQKGLRYIYKIRNTRTNFILEVGSECIKQYEIRVFGLTGKAKDAVLSSMKTRAHMSKKMLDMNLKTNGGLDRFRVSKTLWNNLSFLPSKNLSSEILDCHNILSDHINRIKSSEINISRSSADAFESVLSKLERAMSASQRYVSSFSGTNWLVSQAVYQWAKKEDKKEANKARSPLAALLLDAAEINSKNISRIFEEEHTTKCISLLQESSLCKDFRIEGRKNDNGEVKILVFSNNKQYPFWIRYSSLIHEASIRGFPDTVTIDDQIPITEILIKEKKLFDLNDTAFPDAWQLMNEMCRDAGYSIENINDTGDSYLIRALNSLGTTIESKYLVNPVSRYVLDGIKSRCLDSIRTAMSKQEFVPFNDARSDWKEKYDR